MIEEEGQVLALQGGLAEVVCRRRSSCGNCTVNGACGTSLLERWLGRHPLHIQADNAIGARPGEQVVVGVPAASLPLAAAIVYLLPLLTLFLGGLVGSWWGGLNPTTGMDGPALTGGIGGLGLGIWLSARFNAQHAQDPRFRAIILRRVTAGPLAVPISLDGGNLACNGREN